MFWPRFHEGAFTWAMTVLGSRLMGNVFTFYYVNIFLNHYHISEWWFHVAQIVYMIWNAFNDPLFGYIQDNMQFTWMRTRKDAILWGAPLFAVSFIIPWIPWGNYTTHPWLGGMHLMVSLLFWDTLYTFVVLAQCSLFAEYSTLQSDRVCMVMYGQIAAMVSTSSIVLCVQLSDNLNDFLRFQVTCVGLAVISCACMRYTGHYAVTRFDSTSDFKETSQDTSPKSADDCFSSNMWQQTRDLFSQRSLVSFVLMNMCQVYHVTFLSNFTSVFHEQLVGNDFMPPYARSVYYGAIYFLPQCMVIFGHSIISRSGYYNLFNLSFLLKTCLGLSLFTTGPDPMAITMFILLDVTFSSAASTLVNMTISDLIDHDLKTFNRRRPLSSQVFGANAMFTKPCQSLAPMITLYLLNLFGYQSLQQHKHNSDTIKLPAAETFNVEGLEMCMFYILCATGIIIGIMQAIVWSFYTIRYSHHADIRYVEV